MFYRYRWFILIPCLCFSNIIPKEIFPTLPHVNIQAPKQGTLRLSHVGQPKKLQLHTQSNDTYPGLSEVYETLIEDTVSEDTYVTLLAKNIEINPDSLLITLDENAYFSNLKPLKAIDVLYSIEQFKKKHTHFQLRQLCQHIQARALDEHRILLKHTLASSEALLLLSSIPIIPKGSGALPPGSGPYVLTEYNASSIQYQRNPHYWGSLLPSKIGRYNFDHIIYKFYSSQQAVAKAFQKNEIDYYLEYSAYNWKHKKTTQHCYQLLPHPQQHYQQIIWSNYKKTPLDDPNVRKALQLLITPAYINEWLFYGHYNTPKETDDLSLRQRMIQASIYLDESLWKMEKDGIRYKNGQRLEINLITHHRQLDPMLHLLKTRYDRIGVKLNIQTLSKAHYLYRKHHHDYHLLVKPIVLDQARKSSQDMHFISYYTATPKLNILSQNYADKPAYLAYPLLKTILQTLETESIIKPLWSIDGFRVGYHKDLRFIHQNQSFIDIHAWWNNGQ